MVQTSSFGLSVIMLVVVLAGVFGVGLWLIVFGRRGKRIDDHPVCRACGFDLFGTLNEDGQTRCPECGQSKPPRIGNRRRRKGWVWSGTLMVLLGLGGGGAVLYGAYDPAVLAAYKPMWLLRWEAQSGTSATADVALSEILDRFRNGKLAGPTHQALFGDAVTHGPAGNAALVNAPIGSKWDELAAELMRAGYGTQAQRVAIARSWVEVSLEVRPQVIQGQAVPIRIKRRELGPPYGTPGQLYVERNQHTVRMGEFSHVDESTGSGSLSGTRGSGASNGWTGRRLQPDYELPEGLGLGVHAFSIEQTLSITDGHNGPKLVEWGETTAGQFEYVAPEGDPITLRHDPQMAAALEAGTSVDQQQIKVRKHYSSVSIDIENVSGPIAFRMYLQRGGERWPYGTISANLSNNHGFGTGGDVPDELEDGAVVDLVFVPDVDVARQTTDLTEILDHTLTIPGVKIVRAAASP